MVVSDLLKIVACNQLFSRGADGFVGFGHVGVVHFRLNSFSNLRPNEIRFRNAHVFSLFVRFSPSLTILLGKTPFFFFFSLLLPSSLLQSSGNEKKLTFLFQAFDFKIVDQLCSLIETNFFKNWKHTHTRTCAFFQGSWRNNLMLFTIKRKVSRMWWNSVRKCWVFMKIL